ncbi:ER lumen retaining receptor [Cryptosporidium sp. chipmunk genotype I]|uniref:ER lumen retaining receptor n=1 Tax=Cryptosporidium sp. chipmunk genotype I TaxID=1280935 RepID=UPI00351AAAEA|nr:ER lumen retaining receptor [Cryptosporidium sp. chipmunk genotype I]
MMMYSGHISSKLENDKLSYSCYQGKEKLEYNESWFNKIKSRSEAGVSYQSQLEILFWIAFCLVLMVGYKYLSDGSFSAILTLSSAFQCFAFLLLASKVNTQCSLSGISLRSQILYSIALISKLSSTLFFNGYLPVDRSGDWVYQVADVVSLVISLLLIYWGNTKLKYQYKFDKDSVNIVIPIVFSAILAAVIHPDLNSYFPADFAWTFSLYLETTAMLPQLVMMTKIGGEVETLTSHYLASLATSKILSFVFWLFSYRELAPEHGKNIPGWTVMTSFAIQIILFTDFLYAYIKSVRLGRALIIPTSIV